MNHIQYLSKDKVLSKIISKAKPIELKKENKLYLALCHSIMSQQLSTKVADILRERFMELYKGKTPTPEMIVATPFTDLKKIGLSTSKIHYMFNVCDYFTSNNLTDKMLHALSDEAFIEMMTTIKGVGRWTAEMILMFSMGREDVFPVDDLGIQQQICRLYKIDTTVKAHMKMEMEKVASKWKPYRTYASMYLWAAKDSED